MNKKQSPARPVSCTEVLQTDDDNNDDDDNDEIKEQ